MPFRRRPLICPGVPLLIRADLGFVVRRIGRDAMADLQKLLFDTKARISDTEILAAARLNACVRVFAGRELSDDLIEHINEAVSKEATQLIAEGVLRERPDWLAVIVGRRLHVAFGSHAVQQLCRDLRDAGAV